MNDTVTLLTLTGLAGVPLYLLLKAIARRLLKPKPAIVLAAIAAAALCPFIGDYVMAGVVAVVSAVVDLLRSTKAVE